jgi:peptide/nickel transport system permease protein
VLKLICHRLALGVLVLIGVTLGVFLLLYISPGDPVLSWVGPRATPEQIEEARRFLGLDKPVFVQYFLWLGRLIEGDFGRSIQFSVPVESIVLERMWNTLLLVIASLVIAVPAGFAMGYVAARWRGSLADRFVTFVSLVGASLPMYWLGLVLIVVFALELRWFPAQGMHSVTGGGLADLLHHMVLPAVTASAVPAAVISRMVRTLMIGNLKQDFVLQLRAKGLARGRVMRHVVRNSMPGAVNVIGLQIGYLLGATVFTEVVFQWPGVGLALYDALLARDIPVVQGAVVIIAAAFVLVNLVIDVVALASDPRRY